MIRFGDRVRVKPLGGGRYHGNRCSGKVGQVVDELHRETAMRQADLEWVFVRFDTSDGTTLFFDWVKKDDLRVIK